MFESHHYNVDLKSMLGFKAICNNGMNASTEVVSQRVENEWLNERSAGELGCMKVEVFLLCPDGFGLHSHNILTVYCTLWSYGFWTGVLKILSPRSAFLMEIGSRNPFAEMSIGGQFIHLIRIEFILPSMHWKLSVLSVSVIHEWAGVAGHLAESLSRICHLWFWLSSFSSFARAWTCRS